MGAGGLEEGEAVDFVLGECFFVGVDVAFSEFLKPQQGGEASAVAQLAVNVDEFLLGDVDGGFGVLCECLFFDPGVEGCAGAGVFVFSGGVEAVVYPDYVFGMSVVVLLLAVRGYDIVGRGEYEGEVFNFFGVEAVRLKWGYVCRGSIPPLVIATVH